MDWAESRFMYQSIMYGLKKRKKERNRTERQSSSSQPSLVVINYNYYIMGWPMPVFKISLLKGVAGLTLWDRAMSLAIWDELALLHFHGSIEVF